MKTSCALLAAFLLAACSHSETYSIVAPYNGPNSIGPTVRLTFNSEQDYWPVLTQDGEGFLYGFVQPADPLHRCFGLQRATGGTRIWELCDLRAVEADSASSFSGFALGTDGRLLYVESVTGVDNGVVSLSPSHTTMWLADTAHPFQRRRLLSLPIQVGQAFVSWLNNLQWTGPNTFVALAQEFGVAFHCRFCTAHDTTFASIGLVTGTITDAGATLQLMSGTTDASGYSLADAGQSIVFTKRGDAHLYRVPVTGGTATQVATVPTGAAPQFLGLSCRGTTCIVATNPVILTGPGGFGAAGGGPNQLISVSISTGASQVLKEIESPVISTPLIIPGSGDVVAQLGGGFGYLQTFNASGDLYLYQGLVQ